jgi:hypothetical protein
MFYFYHLPSFNKTGQEHHVVIFQFQSSSAAALLLDHRWPVREQGGDLCLPSNACLNHKMQMKAASLIQPIIPALFGLPKFNEKVISQ